MFRQVGSLKVESTTVEVKRSTSPDFRTIGTLEREVIF